MNVFSDLFTRRECCIYLCFTKSFCCDAGRERRKMKRSLAEMRGGVDALFELLVSVESDMDASMWYLFIC